jgi:hypothetical protein
LSGTDLEAFTLATLRGLGFDPKVADRDDHAVTITASSSTQLIPLAVAVSIPLSGGAVTRDLVSTLRGRLHHYGATHGVLLAISTSEVDSAAATEASSNPSTPIVLINCERLASLALEAGVGVTTHRIEVPILDIDWSGIP